jgi:hypothetical protein
MIREVLWGQKNNLYLYGYSGVFSLFMNLLFLFFLGAFNKGARIKTIDMFTGGAFSCLKDYWV